MVEIFAISGLINGLLSLGFGFFIILHNWRAKVNQIYFLIIVAVGIWSLSYWQWLSSDKENYALFWVRMLSIGSILIPVFYFQWIVHFLDLNIQQKRAIRLTYFLALIFLIFSFSDLFVKGVRQKLFFPFWPDPGILYHFYLFFTYIILVLYSLILLFKNYKISSKEKKGQMVYVLSGSIVGFGGGLSNFFLWYDIPLPPYGNLLVALFPFLFGYAIIKHRLFNIRIITTEFFTFAIWAFLLLKIFFSSGAQDLLINVILFIIVILFGVLLIRSVLQEVRQREQIEEMAKQVQKAYELEKHAHKELKRLDEAKTQFLMATQHHLRTPLTSMRGYVDLILGGLYGRIPQKIKEVILKFEKSTINEIKIVNELLDISQFQLGKEVVSLKPNIQIEPILNEVIEELKFEAESEGIYLKLEKDEKPLPLIKADPSKLKVALSNIIDNAIKYTKQGGVTIKCQISNDKLQIIVQDTGMGMSAEEQENLFTRLFERGAEAKKVFTTGRGIGLYLTAKIIEVHHGRIWAESEGKGKGSTFYVELPV